MRDAPGNGFILPDAGGIIGGLPHPLEKEIRRKECPPREDGTEITEPVKVY